MTIAPESGTTTVFSKKVNLIQSGVAINNGVITGTLNYIEHWTGYSPSDDEMATGNYLALKFTPTDENAVIQTRMIPGNKPLVTLDEDLNVVYRVASNDQIIEVVVDDSTGHYVEYLSLNLTLNTE